MESSEIDNGADPSHQGTVPLSEVGCEGLNSEENTRCQEPSKPNLVLHMEALLSRLLSTPQPQPTTSATTQLIRFDPDESEADIEGWCRLAEIIIESRKLEGAELLLVLTHALKGRAASCLTKLQASQLTWPQIKELLLAKFSRPMLAQDYFDEILRFQIGSKETACEAAARLWNLVERIPRTEMSEDIVVGFVASVLCHKDGIIRRELHANSVTTRTQLFRILNGVSSKRRHDGNDPTYDIEAKRTRPTESRFTGSCHRCGIQGHRAIDCRKRRDDPVAVMKTPEQPAKIPERTRQTTCFVCGQPGHLASSCPDRKGGGAPAASKEVHVCERKSTKSTLTTSSDSGQLPRLCH
ncbi:hypothetical protein ABMA28_005470 [Loxostege sticticalis]|uniref:CCHC-type domain-containing protein n=1 Tax=Loxostege sticticalis TaxID=481309 RepID=A0ABD0SUR8_LOXSC